MDELATLEYAVEELRRTVTSLDDSHMETVTNCEPWTVRRLASHALNNQLLWAGLVTGQPAEAVVAERELEDRVVLRATDVGPARCRPQGDDSDPPTGAHHECD